MYIKALRKRCTSSSGSKQKSIVYQTRCLKRQIATVFTQRKDKQRKTPFLCTSSPFLLSLIIISENSAQCKTFSDKVQTFFVNNSSVTVVPPFRFIINFKSSVTRMLSTKYLTTSSSYSENDISSSSNQLLICFISV